MASKFQFITELYSRTLTGLTGDYESWMGFLRSACYNYKCPFDEQVLIYAQRPDATAVLELEKWNRQFGRWVNAGATGIAVIDEARGKGRLKHYFDITDTHATRISRPVPIWSMEPAYTEPVIETLEATFGTLAERIICRTPYCPPAATLWRIIYRTICGICWIVAAAVCWRSWTH